MIANLNGDDIPDIVALTGTFKTSDEVNVLLGTDTGSFSAAAGYPFKVGKYPSFLAIADVNGDGKPDLIVANSGDNNVSVLLSLGNGTFAPAPNSPFAVGMGPSSVAVADVNGDGKPDIVTANAGDSSITVLLGTCTGSFFASPSSPITDLGSPPPDSPKLGSPNFVWITRPDGWNIYFNQQWFDSTGLTLAESLGHGWNKPCHPRTGSGLGSLGRTRWRRSALTRSNVDCASRVGFTDGG